MIRHCYWTASVTVLGSPLLLFALTINTTDATLPVTYCKLSFPVANLHCSLLLTIGKVGIVLHLQLLWHHSLHLSHLLACVRELSFFSRLSLLTYLCEKLIFVLTLLTQVYASHFIMPAPHILFVLTDCTLLSA